MATPEQSEKEVDSLYLWHGLVAKVDGRNAIVLMNDKTMYCLLLRNKLPRNKDKFTDLVLEAIHYTLEVGHSNRVEIDGDMSSAGSVVYAEKADRQITGNINHMISNMGYSWDYEWREDETIQAYEAYEQNRDLRKMGKDFIIPFDEMLKSLCR